MIVLEKKHIKLLIGGFVASFLVLSIIILLFMSFLFKTKYDSIYTDDISSIKIQLEKYQKLDEQLLASLEGKYEKIIEQKDMEIDNLKTDLRQLETLFVVYKENKEKDIETIMEYTYALDQSQPYYLTYEDIESIINECKREGFNEYAPHMVIALMEFESGLNPQEVSSTDARGIAQFKEGTAKWIYEDYLGYEKYNHNYAFDTQLSIQMCIKYLSILYDKHGGNIDKMLIGYNGEEIGSVYHDRVNRNMVRNTGYSIYDVCKDLEEEVPN